MKPESTKPTKKPKKEPKARPVLFTDEQIITAIKATMGKVYIASERLGCNPGTIYDRIKKSPAVADAMTAASERIIDTAELALAVAVNRGEWEAIKYLLDRKGKSRGYSVRQEIEHSGGLMVTKAAKDMTDDELASIAALASEPTRSSS